MRRTKNIFAFIILLILSAGVGLGVYLGVTKHNTNNIYNVSQSEKQIQTPIPQQEKTENKNDLIFFPELKQENYYKYIKIENERAVFDKEIVLAISKDVAKNPILVNGTLKYKYKFSNANSKLTISFVWVTSDNEQKKHTYILDLSQPEKEEMPTPKLGRHKMSVVSTTSFPHNLKGK